MQYIRYYIAFLLKLKQYIDFVITIADVYTELEKIAHMQYFSFRSFVSGLRADSAEGDDVNEYDAGTIKLLNVQYVVANAQSVSYPDAWPGTTIFYTSGSLEPSDDDQWQRNLTTKYSDGKLTWSQVHSTNGSTIFSYWPPYVSEKKIACIYHVRRIIC